MLREGDAQSGHEAQASNEGVDATYVCAECGRRITRRSAGIAVSGAHVHTFTNPDRERFTIGCFGSAEGLIRYGASSDEATWFTGFTWQNELCASCRSFIGWLYRRGGETFHGLVLSQMEEADGDE